MAIRFFLILLFILGLNAVKCHSVHAQLTGNIKTNDVPDWKTLDKAFWAATNSDLDSALFFANEMLNLFKNNKEKKAEVYYKIGLVWYLKNDFTKAEDFFLIAINNAEQIIDKKTIARSYENLGQIYYQRAVYNTAIEYFLKAQENYYQINLLGYATMMGNYIAIQHEALGQFNQAISYYNQNVKILDSISNKENILLSYNQLVKIYGKLHNYNLAYRYLLEGIEYAKKKNKASSLIELYITAGNLFLENNINDDAALAYFLEAKNYINNIADPALIYIELCVGDLYFKAGNDSIAAEIFQQAITQINSNNQKCNLADAYLKLGLLNRKNKQYDSALVYFQKSIETTCSNNAKILAHQAMIEKGKTYLLTSQYDKAKQILMESRNNAEKVSAKYKMLLSDQVLADYYQMTQKPDSALFYLTSVFDAAGTMGLLTEKENAANLLSQIYYSKGNFKKASNFLLTARQMNDSLAIHNKSDELAKLQVLLEINQEKMKRQLETKASSLEIKKQKFIKNYVIAGAFFFALLTILLFMAYRRKGKDNKLLANQKIEIENMARQLHENDKNKLRFFTNLSHEIRTPLTLIKLPLQKLQSSESTNSNLNNQLHIALNNTEKLQQIVNQILDLRKLDDGQLNLKITEFDLISFLKDIAQSFETLSQQTSCKLYFHANISSAIVKLDQDKIYSMVSNLLSNAFKYSYETGVIKIVIKIEPEQMELSVIDNGIGIANKYLNKIGTRYFQIEENIHSAEGSGIGLAYVKELVAFLNGNFEISSEPQKGTTVKLVIPYSEIIINDKKELKFEIKPTQNAYQQITEILTNKTFAHQQSVLIVEDNAELRSFLCSILKSNFNVIEAKDGIDGQEKAIKFDPNFIISDIMMPGLAGNEMCRNLKNDIKTSHIPIILLTAKDDQESQLDGYYCGADDYIVKPFDAELLLQKVKNMVTTTENARKQFSFTDIESKKQISCSEIDRELLSRCMVIVNENLDKSNFTVDTLSDYIGLNRKTLHRKFKVITGKSPSDLIRHTRMSHAAILLRDKHLRVNEVATLVGYEDTERFSNAFKQFHGVAPSSYS